MNYIVKLYIKDKYVMTSEFPPSPRKIIINIIHLINRLKRNKIQHEFIMLNKILIEN